jgi:anti-sigma regulatory factor (Ser/Thr protein kinase)
MTAMDMNLDLQLPREPRAPQAARHVIDGLAGHLPQDVLDRFRLVISELVTNAVQHAPDSAEPIRLLAHIDADAVRVDITDGGKEFEPPTRRPRPDKQSGWGLFLVDALADRWGLSRQQSSGVWCEFDVERDAPSQRAGGGGGSGGNLRAA